MKQLSTGEDSTLGTYRKLAVGLFGEESKAVAFIDGKIADQGADEEVIADESQVMFLLISL